MKQKDVEDGWRGFCQLITKESSLKGVRELLECFLTFEEREMIAARYKILQCLLEQHYTQREISKTLEVSISQITRGSNQLKTLSSGRLEYLKKSLSKS